MSDRKSRFDEARAVSDKIVLVTVTGVDVKGQMFRHSATVLMLDGLDCAFLSKSQPALGGSVLVEFDYPQADPKLRVSQARVKSNQADIESGFCRVVVELEAAQTMRVVPKQVESQTAVNKPALLPIPAGTVCSAEGKGGPGIAPRESPKSSVITQALPRPPNHEDSATIKFESHELLPKTRAEDPIAVREAVKSAVTSEIKQEIKLLKNWISSELERTLVAIVSSKMEKMICEAVEKQAAAQLSTCAGQFENQLNKICTERAVQFSMEIEKHLAPHRQRVDETVEKLGGMLQLLQGTARVQQERLTEHSRNTAVNFEKEIRAFLLRLAGGA